MKTPALILLVLSLAANVAMVAMLPSSPATGEVSPAAHSSSAPDRVFAGSVSGDPDGAGAERRPASATHVEPWTAIASTDFASVRDGLRALGVPEEYVRAVVWARIRHAHRAEYEGLARKRGEWRYWMARDRAAEQANTAVERELDQRLRAEFANYFDQPLGVEARARQSRERLAFLPADKADAVAKIAEDYNEMRRQIQNDIMSGAALPEDQEKLILLDDERRADLARVLSPEELELYELHTSQTAQTLRMRLGLFEPTEAEFRAIFALQREFDREYGATFGPTSQEKMRARADAQKLLNEQISAALGSERYADYERCGDYSYRTAVKIVEHFKLPQENAVAVYALQAEYRRRAQEIMRASTDRAATAAAAQTLAAEASARVSALLGEEGAKAFRESGGSWLRSLEQQARRASGTREP